RIACTCRRRSWSGCSGRRSSPSPLREPRWPRTVALCTGDRRVLELPVVVHAAEEKAAATHVAAPDEGRWEEQSVPEHGEQRLGVARAGHAAEEHDARILAGEAVERLRVPEEWRQVARLAGLHPYLGVPAQPIDRHGFGGVAQPFTRCDHERTAQSGRRTPEGARVGELPPEVERAEKAEHLAEGH